MAFHPSLPLSTPARIHDFTLWFTYYPPLHPAPLSLLHTHLKSSPQTSLPFYTTLSLLLARKGYISFSNTHLLPSISRYSPSNFLEFYHTYESSIHSYFSTLKSPTGLRKTLSITRSIAIRFLAEAGHLSVAVSLLSPQYALHPKSHSILLSRLLAAPPSPTRDLHIAKLRSPTRGIHTKWNSPRKQSNTPKETLTLRYISRALLSPDPRNFPSTNDLVSFFSLYISLHSSPPSSRNAITLLHTHTLRLSPIPLRAISHLLFAHMVLLFRLGTRSPSPSIPSLGPRALRALLDLFLRHFHIHGVSVPTMLQYTSTTEDSSDSSSFYLSTLSSLPTPTSPYPLLPKLFPSRLHISLIWQSLAHLAPSHHALIELYNELIHYASPQPQVHSQSQVQSQQIPTSNLQTPKSWTSRGHRLPSTPTPYPPLQWHSHAHPSPIIAECFTPFIIKLMHASTYPSPSPSSLSPSSPSLSTRHPNTHIRSPTPLSLSTPSPTSLPSPTSILRTLLSLSLSPTIYHYTEMARWWAWQGHESKVWIVLDRLESEGGGVALERGGGGQGGGGGESKGRSVDGRRSGNGKGDAGAVHKDHQVLQAITSEDSQNHQNHQNHENPPPPPPLPLSPASSPSPSSPSNPNHTPLPPPDLPFYIALMRAFLSSPNYHSLSPPSSSPTPSPSFPSSLSPLSPPSPSSLPSPTSLSSSLPTPSPSPNLPPYPPTSPYPGTLRRLSALSRLWAHMELRFGRAYLLEQLGISTGIGSGIGSGGGGTRGVRGVGSGGTGVGSASGTGTGRRSGGSGSPRVEDDDTVDEDHGDRDDDAPTSTSTSTLTPHTPNPYLSKAVSNWRALAGIPSPRTSSSIPSPRTLSSIPPRSHERRT